MKYFLLKRIDQNKRWEVAYGFVISAKNEMQARKLAIEADCSKDWEDPALTTCTHLKRPTQAEVILADVLEM